MPSRLAMPTNISEVDFDFDWDKRMVWALDVESEVIDREQLDWLLDLPFWSSRPPEPRFDLIPRRVIADPSIHPVHARRIEQADMSFPLDVIKHNGRLCIMDGFHRLAKAVMEGGSGSPCGGFQGQRWKACKLSRTDGVSVGDTATLGV